MSRCKFPIWKLGDMNQPSLCDRLPKGGSFFPVFFWGDGVFEVTWRTQLSLRSTWGCWKMCVPCLIRWQHQHLQELRIRRQGGVVFGQGCRRKTAGFFCGPQKGWFWNKNHGSEKMGKIYTFCGKQHEVWIIKRTPWRGVGKHLCQKKYDLYAFELVLQGLVGPGASNCHPKKP